MKVYSIYDSEFKPYGRVIKGGVYSELMSAMDRIPMPETGVAYERGIDSLQACGIIDFFRDSVFGGMPVQLGMCWGHNTMLNCLEYHRDSEFNLGTGDFLLLLAKQDEIGEDMMLDTSFVKAFRVPAGVLIEVYATTLHYAPCHVDAETGFRVLVALPKGTNGPKPTPTGLSPEDRYLTACNKWLLPHPDSSEAMSGAVVGLKGKNICIGNDIK